MGMYRPVYGKFKGVYHVYTENGKRQIEEFFFSYHEDCFPTDDFDTIQTEWQSVDFHKELQDLPEIEAITKEEFYFQIYGDIEIEYFSSSWEYPSEVDSEISLPVYKIKEISEKDACLLGGICTYQETVTLKKLDNK